MALALSGVSKPVEFEMQRIVDDAVSEIVRECEDAKWIFTDGRLDARHAIKVLPNSPEVKQTLEDALKKAP